MNIVDTKWMHGSGEWFRGGGVGACRDFIKTGTE